MNVFNGSVTNNKKSGSETNENQNKTIFYFLLLTCVLLMLVIQIYHTFTQLHTHRRFIYVSRQKTNAYTRILFGNGNILATIVVNDAVA